MQSAPPNAPGLTAVPLFHAAWLFALGIVVASRFWFRPSFVLIALALVVALCGVAAVRAQRIAWLPLAVLWLLLGAWCAEMEPHPAPAPALAELSDGLLRTVEGTVADTGPLRTEMEQNIGEPVAAAPTQRVDLRVATLEVVTDQSDTQTPVNGGVRLTVRWPADEAARKGLQAFRCGERIQRRGSSAAAGNLSRSRRLEPRGFSPRSGHHVDSDGGDRSRGAAGRNRGRAAGGRRIFVAGVEIARSISLLPGEGLATCDDGKAAGTRPRPCASCRPSCV